MKRILIIIAVVIVVGTGVWYFYIRPMSNGANTVPKILEPFFPNVVSNENGSFGEDDPSIAGDTPTASTAAFKQLTARPIAGYTTFNISRTVTIPAADPKDKPEIRTVIDHYVRYVSRSNGYVYEIKNADIPLQVSNIFIPNIYEAYFADNNNTALLRFLRSNNQTIATYNVPIPPLNTDGTRTQKSGTYLADNISDLTVSSDQKQILRVTHEKNGAVFTTSNSLGTGSKIVARTPFQQWIPQWNTKNIFVQTRAAASAEGFLYSIDLNTARLRRVAGNVLGLTSSVSPSGTYVLYSESAGEGFSAKIFNTKTNVTSNVNLSVLPEKCTWLANEDLVCAGNSAVFPGAYPDAWYSGTMHFSDQLYRIATASNVYSVLFDGKSQSFDMTGLRADESQRLIFFIDKASGTLWQFKY
jgi:hypothetical protein